MDITLEKPYMTPMKPLPTNLSPVGSLRRPVQCLMCDIYGTLLISSSGDIGVAQNQRECHQLISELLAKYRFDLSPAMLIKNLNTSIRMSHKRSKARGVGYPEIEIDKIWSQIVPESDTKRIRSFSVEFEMIMNPVWPMPGLQALINSCLKNRLWLGIISNAQFFTPHIFLWCMGKDLQTLGFEPQLTFFSYQHGWAKPSLYLYRLAVKNLKRIGIPVDRVAYIGNDMRNDIAPAQKLGFQTVLFAGDARSLRLREDDQACHKVRPDLRITHLNQLVPYLTTK